MYTLFWVVNNQGNGICIHYWVVNRGERDIHTLLGCKPWGAGYTYITGLQTDRATTGYTYITWLQTVGNGIYIRYWVANRQGNGIYIHYWIINRGERDIIHYNEKIIMGVMRLNLVEIRDLESSARFTRRRLYCSDFRYIEHMVRGPLHMF